MNTQVHLYFVGDISFGRHIDLQVKKQGAAFLFETIRPTLAKAHLVFANLESPLSNRGKPIQRPRLILPNGTVYETVALRGDPLAAAALKEANIGVVSLANNHLFDYGTEAFEDTLQVLNKEGVRYVGAGESPEKAYEPVILSVKGIPVAFLAYTPFAQEAPPGFMGCAQAEPAIMCQAIKRVKKFAAVVIVSLHWGEEDCHYPFPKDVKIAHKLIDAGADLIVGHHPHVLQGIEKYREGWICYSLGNFAFDDIKARRRESIILRCTLSATGIVDLDWLPVVINEHCQPELASPPADQDILGNIITYSRMFADPYHPAWKEMSMIHSRRVVSALWRLGFWHSLCFSLPRINRLRFRHLREFYRMMKCYLRI